MRVRDEHRRFCFDGSFIPPLRRCSSRILAADKTLDDMEAPGPSSKFQRIKWLNCIFLDISMRSLCSILFSFVNVMVAWKPTARTRYVRKTWIYLDTIPKSTLGWDARKIHFPS